MLLLGDGAAGFSLMDVDTLVRHDLPVVMVMGNNSAWGLEKGPMQMLYGYDVIADLAPRTAYDEVVKALGGGGETVTDPRQIGSALDRAFDAERALPRQRHHRRQRGLPARDVRHLRPRIVRIRRAEPRDHAAIGEVTVAAYAGLSEADEGGYTDKLRDAATRDREAELWVATVSDDRRHDPRHRDRLPRRLALARDRPRGRGRVPDARGVTAGPGPGRRRRPGRAVHQPVPRGRRAGDRALDAARHARRAPALRAPRVRARPERDWSPVPGVDLVAYHLDLAP